MTVTTEDIKVAKQHIRTCYARLTLLNRAFYAVGYIQGKAISGSISITMESNAQRSASLTLQLTERDMQLATNIAMSHYIQLSLGIETANTSVVRWYQEGVFIIKSSDISIDPANQTVSLSLSDMMIDLTGERKGALHAYTTIAKNSQSVKKTIENVLDLAGVQMYDVCEIETISEIDVEFAEPTNLIPYDIELSVGASAYDIIEKCVNLYPYYEMGFDVDGAFFVRKSAAEQDSSSVTVDAFALNGMILSEKVSIPWSEVKNVVEVWGKDGLYYGEAYDVTPDSPFNTFSEEIRRLVITGAENGVDPNNIYDRFKDTKKAAEILTRRAELETEINDLSMLKDPTPTEVSKLSQDKQELATVMRAYKQNIYITGNELADQWAEWLLYKKARLNDKISLQTLFMPFLNDVGFKISYRSKSDGKLKTYKVTGVTHDIGGQSTSLDCARFYNEQVSAYKDMLDTPIISSCTTELMSITVVVEPVEYAQTYKLYIDSKPVATSSGTTISVVLPETWEGTHYINVRASSNEYRDSAFSNPVGVTLTPPAVLLRTETDDLIATENNENIILEEVI